VRCDGDGDGQLSLLWRHAPISWSAWSVVVNKSSESCEKHGAKQLIGWNQAKGHIGLIGETA